MAKQWQGWDKETLLETVVVDEKNKYDIVETELKGYKYLQYVPYFMSKEGWKTGTRKSLRMDIVEIFVGACNKYGK